MKTKKARMNQIILAAFLIALLMSGNVNAKGTEVTIASGLENIAEPKLEVESWMVDETYWHTSENTYIVENEQDENLFLEPWMLNENKWQLPVFKYTSMEPEQSLLLENWMVNEMYWN